jgi:hypothetical protein
MLIKCIRDGIGGNGVLEFTRMMQDRRLGKVLQSGPRVPTGADSDPPGPPLCTAVPFCPHVRKRTCLL